MIIFPHTDNYEFPILDLRKQARVVVPPVAGWGAVSRKSRFRGTWHFYIDDSKFSALWKNPDGALKTRAYAAVEPNFSTHSQMPKAIAIYRLFQKRWIARYWQENGMEIWADLNVAQEYEMMNLEGVPKGWKSYATHATDNRLATLQRHAQIARNHAESDDIRLLVYGGMSGVAKLCEYENWIHIRDARNEARDG